MKICEYRGLVLKIVLDNVLFTMYFCGCIKNIQKKASFALACNKKLSTFAPAFREGASS